MKKKILITTAIDYVNDVIHIGHAYQKILADCVARFERVRRGRENVFFVTGTDEHGQKVYSVAGEKGVSVKDFVDEISKKDKEQQDSLKISYDRFIRTTDEDHKKTATEFFKKVYDAGYIYKDIYKGLYCEGCEAYKTEKDLADGKCPLHPDLQHPGSKILSAGKILKSMMDLALNLQFSHLITMGYMMFYSFD